MFFNLVDAQTNMEFLQTRNCLFSRRVAQGYQIFHCSKDVNKAQHKDNKLLIKNIFNYSLNLKTKLKIMRTNGIVQLI